MREVRIAAPATRDVAALLKVSRKHFGVKASRAYLDLIENAYAKFAADPARAGVRQRENLHGAPQVFHLRHARTRGVAPKQPRHIIVFIYDAATLTILRVLHDSMDITQRARDDESEA